MTEINNNIQGYGYKIDGINIKKDMDVKSEKKASNLDRDAEQQYIADTGVLGRSQIRTLKGSNIDKSVDEAVEIAKNCPIRMGCSEQIFDTMYQNYLNSGLNEMDSYTKALLGEEEFLQISSKYNR